MCSTFKAYAAARVPDADPFRALIAEATKSVVPWLTGQG